MKFFIVDNGSKYLDNIIARISTHHEYFVQTYSPYESLDPKDADIIILSGGMQNEVADDLKNGDPWYRHEFTLIQESQIPILGICLGLQMIAVALGGSLKRLPYLVDATKTIYLTTYGQELLQLNTLQVHEKHQWTVTNYESTGLQLVADSNDGVETLYYPERNIIGTQFHPEIDVNDESEPLFWKLIDTIMQPVGLQNEK